MNTVFNKIDAMKPVSEEMVRELSAKEISIPADIPGSDSVFLL